MITKRVTYLYVEAGELKSELLGCVRINTLYRMTATMKASVINRKHKEYFNNETLAGFSVRHNLELYNDGTVEKFVRKVAERLEVSTITIKKNIADI